MKKITLLSLFLSLSTGVLSGQEREGNIVEYFGKEKVEELHEGEVLHIFQEGLVLEMRSFPAAAESVLSDQVLARVIAQGENNITEGSIGGKNFSGEDLKWRRIAVEENNEFNDNGLRSGYLHLEYESDSEKYVIFEASGHTLAIVNGLPHEGDHYDFGWSLIPVKLKKGKNEFVLSGGRFSRMRARLLEPEKPVQLTTRDLTLPDVLREDKEPLLGAIRVINSSDDWLKGARIIAEVADSQIESGLPSVPSLHVRKVPFSIPVPKDLSGEEVAAVVRLEDSKGKVLSSDTLSLRVTSKHQHHKKTFLSSIDGSVQYYSVAPSLDTVAENQALFLSVHGASVEAVNQANAYDQKDWGHLVAPTNRRPFGFAWEDWGRLDAMEVLSHAEDIYNTDPQRTYLTGHSMGGHGTWYLGATYPDRFAAIAPCAGYPDLLEYRQSFMKRLEQSPEEYFERFGMTKTEFLSRMTAGYEQESDIRMDDIVRRAGNPSRTLMLLDNYLHFGIYVLHGEVDSVVPTFIAREMRERLGQFHNDFAYYEYPGGAHWYGDHSVDWPPIFYFFENRQIQDAKDITDLKFTTASPGISAKSHFVTIVQQEKPFDLSSFEFNKAEGELSLKTGNVKTLRLDLAEMMLPDSIRTVNLDEQVLELPEERSVVFFGKQDGSWNLTSVPSRAEKGPHRDGGFKDAFKNNVVFVYATKGTQEENEWYYNRAKFDAEKFWYRANGNIELIKDTDFRPADYKDRNVILYGNRNNNAAWNRVLKNSPVQVSKNTLNIGGRTFTGDQWGAYFIVPRTDSEIASIGVVTATGERGMRGAYANDYLENGTFFPDLMVFDDSMMAEGISGLKMSGFFGNSWKVEDGDFYWRE